MTYIVRELWKSNIKKGVNSGKRRKLLIGSSSNIADKAINNVSVVANNEIVSMYACKEWVDEVLIVLPKEITYPNTLIE